MAEALVPYIYVELTERDTQNYSDLRQCYLPNSKSEVDNINRGLKWVPKSYNCFIIHSVTLTNKTTKH